jgi:hypothetical protein
MNARKIFSLITVAVLLVLSGYAISLLPAAVASASAQPPAADPGDDLLRSKIRNVE